MCLCSSNQSTATVAVGNLNAIKWYLSANGINNLSARHDLLQGLASDKRSMNKQGEYQQHTPASVQRICGKKV